MSAASLNRLSVRLGIGLTLLVVIPLSAGLYTLSHHHFDRTIKARRHSAELQNRILESTPRHQMVEKDTDVPPQIRSGSNARVPSLERRG